MNLLIFSLTSIFHVIIVKKQLIKHEILTHCLACNFRHMTQYNSFPSVWRGLTEHRREHLVYISDISIGVNKRRNFQNFSLIICYQMLDLTRFKNRTFQILMHKIFSMEIMHRMFLIRQKLKTNLNCQRLDTHIRIKKLEVFYSQNCKEQSI